MLPHQTRAPKLFTHSAGAIVAIALVALSPALFAQATYQTPSKALVDIVDAPTTPQVRLDPTHEWLLLLEVPSLPRLAELAERELRLAGTRIKPSHFGPSRTRSYSGLALRRLAGGEERRVTGLPRDPRIENVSFAPNGEHIAFTITETTGITVWVADVESAKARRLSARRLNLTLRVGPTWTPDSASVLLALVPNGVGAEPDESPVPAGPTIEQTTGRKAPARTYQDLLGDPHDEALFEHYFTSQLARVDLDGKLTELGSEGIYIDADPAPSGELILVQRLHRPYSYRVPWSRFPRQISVWNSRGKAVHQLADLPLQEEVPMAFGSVPTGPRSVQWRADSPATLVWVEALDGGDARARASDRDRLFALEAPFTGEPKTLTTLGLRYAGVTWGGGDLALVYERWWQTRQQRIWRLAPDRTEDEAELLIERSYEDRYSDPGSPEIRPNEAGRNVLYRQGESDIFLIGSGASPEGDRPFLDRFDLDRKSAERLFRSEAPHYELPVQVLADASGQASKVLVRRESKTEPPNYFLRDLGSDSLTQITDFGHPTPQLEGISKELIKYQRDDGVELTATLYLPPGYEPSDGPLPMLMWAYPREFKSAAAASQVRGSPHRFDRIDHWSSKIWLAKGYAVLDDPAMPIIGEGDQESNDTYVEQLVGSAKAAVDEVVRRGVTTADRIAIGGHSYGAFMTANLLSHSDLFAAGIARSGAYNRTLTPFGFQAEQRSLWEAPEIYFAMSPFMHAHKVNEPILLIHGEVDNNSGTFPLQSRRYYSALKGHGATARLVMLPYESHGYRARESLLHMLWEQEQWLDRYVKNRGASGATSGVERP